MTTVSSESINTFEDLDVAMNGLERTPEQEEAGFRQLDAALVKIASDLRNFAIKRSKVLRELDRSEHSTQCGFNLCALLEFKESGYSDGFLNFDDARAPYAFSTDVVKLPLRLVAPLEIRHWEGEMRHVNRKQGPMHGETISWVLHRLYARQSDGGQDNSLEDLLNVKRIVVTVLTEQHFRYDVSPSKWTKAEWKPWDAKEWEDSQEHLSHWYDLPDSAR